MGILHMCKYVQYVTSCNYDIIVIGCAIPDHECYSTSAKCSACKSEHNGKVNNDDSSKELLNVIVDYIVCTQIILSTLILVKQI